MIKIHKAEDMPLYRFGEELKELMVKHDLKSITPAFNDAHIEINDKGGITIIGFSFQNGIEEKELDNVIQFPSK